MYSLATEAPEIAAAAGATPSKLFAHLALLLRLCLTRLVHSPQTCDSALSFACSVTSLDRLREMKLGCYGSDNLYRWLTTGIETSCACS